VFTSSECGASATRSQQTFQVSLDGVLANKQRGSDFFIASALNEQLQYFHFSFRHVGTPHDDRNCARLEYTGDISSKPGTNASPMAIQIEKGKIAGTMWFDPDLGMVVGTTGDQDMDMKITAQGKPITTTLSQKVNLKLVEVADLEK
jgi:hypothetical protein